MKEYRLAAWPELPAHYQRTPHRRMLSDMSHRYVTLSQLVECSGQRRQEVRHFVEMLGHRGLLSTRDVSAAESLFDSMRPLGAWLRRTLATGHGR